MHIEMIDLREVDMGANRPTRNHYVPQMLLKNFCEDNGRLWIGDKIRGKVYQASPTNVFVRGKLYVKQNYSEENESYEYEHILSKIESNAEPAVSSIIEQVRCRKNPHLDPNLNKQFKEFVMAQARRTPESQERVFSGSDRILEEVVDSVSKELLTQAGYDIPEQDWFDRHPGILELKRKLKSNHNANFAAGDHHLLQQETERFSRETGWGVALICLPKRSFVIGSHGVTIIRRGGSIRGSWLPIAHDIVVQITAFPERGFRLHLERKNESIIKSINRETAAQSDIIAGRSEALVRSLMENSGIR